MRNAREVVWGSEGGSSGVWTFSSSLSLSSSVERCREATEETVAHVEWEPTTVLCDEHSLIGADEDELEDEDDEDEDELEDEGDAEDSDIEIQNRKLGFP